MKNIIPAFILVVCFLGCKKNADTPDVETTIAKLYLSPKPDTVYLDATDRETKDLKLSGIFLDKTKKTVSNTGVITHSEFIVISIDSNYRTINATDADWISSNANVQIIRHGTMRAEIPGTTLVWAQYQGMTSDTLIVNARMHDVAPGLALNPSNDIFTLQNFVQIQGTVQRFSRLRMSESISGFVDTNVTYDADGNFNRTVTGLVPGKSTIVVKAYHNTRDDLVTTRTRNVYYFNFGSLTADSIVGNWRGECGGKPIVFSISKNQYLPRYDISGTIDIQCYGYGLIQDVVLWGIVNNDGSMSITATKEFEGFSVSGTLKGKFRSVGTGDGSLAGSLRKNGWIDFSFNESWWAKKSN
jgi:hypothetical protein